MSGRVTCPDPPRRGDDWHCVISNPQNLPRHLPRYEPQPFRRADRGGRLPPLLVSHEQR
jgi:hypothetical protein